MEKQIISRKYKEAVSKSLQNTWLKNWRAGHNKKISDATGLSYPVIIDAIKNGLATKNTVDLINGFYGIGKKAAA